MRAVAIVGGFGLQNVQVVERPDPVPGPGEVVVRTRAVSLNYRDLLVVKGRYNPRQTLPLVPCSDAVGVVTSTGPGVSRVSVGDRVATLFAQRWWAGPPTAESLGATLGSPLDGTLCEQLLLDAEGVVAVPAYLSDVEAATLPCAGLTAWHALFDAGGLQAGDTVLVIGTGGVSVAALQLASAAGARVIITSSSDEKLERARAAGAWQTINYVRDLEWGRTARDLTGGRGVDLVIEVGGAGTLEQSLRAVRPGGSIQLIGILAGSRQPVNLLPILMRNVRIQGIFVGSRAMFQDLNRALEAGQIRPVVDRVHPFEDAARALAELAEGRHFGKICLALG